MLAPIILGVFRELKPALKELIRGIRTNDRARRTRALIRLENEAERLAMAKARGL